jgi:hypothetical protein
LQRLLKQEQAQGFSRARILHLQSGSCNRTRVVTAAVEEEVAVASLLIPLVRSPLLMLSLISVI